MNYFGAYYKIKTAELLWNFRLFGAKLVKIYHLGCFGTQILVFYLQWTNRNYRDGKSISGLLTSFVPIKKLLYLLTARCYIYDHFDLLWSF